MATTKYKRGTRVRIAKDLGQMMSHFENDCAAIVEYSYAQAYGGGADGHKQYSVLLLDDKGKALHTVAWYDEDQLTLINNYRDEGEAILDKYIEECSAEYDDEDEGEL